MSAVAFDVLQVGILTGFLGSGKTTLLRRWLHSEDSSETAVLINEFGSVGIDHLLVDAIDSDTVLLDNGCVCCSIRGELKEALLRLFSRRQQGLIPAFKRVVIETTGLAAPGPVLATLLGDAQLGHHFKPAFIATVIDAVHAWSQQHQHAEWLAQVASADTLWLSKLDLVTPAQEQQLQAMLADINPLARQLRSTNATSMPWPEPNQDASTNTALNWISRVSSGSLRAKPVQGLALPDQQRPATTQAASFCLIFERPIEWFTLTLWLTLLMHRHGARLLRIKGLLRIKAEGFTDGQPTVLHGINHLMHPPQHLDSWPDADPRSRLVFITEGLSEQEVSASWHEFEHFYA